MEPDIFAIVLIAHVAARGRTLRQTWQKSVRFIPGVYDGRYLTLGFELTQWDTSYQCSREGSNKQLKMRVLKLDPNSNNHGLKITTPGFLPPPSPLFMPHPPNPKSHQVQIALLNRYLNCI